MSRVAVLLVVPSSRAVSSAGLGDSILSKIACLTFESCNAQGAEQRVL